MPGASPAPTRTGYTFIGYYDTSNITGGTVYYTSEMESANFWNKNVESYTLYARWIEYGCTLITFEKNGGSKGTSSVIATYGQSMPSATAPTKPSDIIGTFGGYYDAIIYGTQYYTSAMESARNWDKTEPEFTLYAMWVFGDGGDPGTTSIDDTNETQYTDSLTSINKEIDTTIYDNSVTLSQNQTSEVTISNANTLIFENAPLSASYTLSNYNNAIIGKTQYFIFLKKELANFMQSVTLIL